MNSCCGLASVRSDVFPVMLACRSMCFKSASTWRSCLPCIKARGKHLPMITDSACFACIQARYISNKNKDCVARSWFDSYRGLRKSVALDTVTRTWRTTGDADTKRVSRNGFLLFAFSVICWSLDGLACSQLQRLPFGYNPQLHATGWHVGISTGSCTYHILTRRT